MESRRGRRGMAGAPVGKCPSCLALPARPLGTDREAALLFTRAFPGCLMVGLSQLSRSSLLAADKGRSQQGWGPSPKGTDCPPTPVLPVTCSRPTM